MTSKLVGQELAVRQATDAICDHLQDTNPRRPLVLSGHGPPGVGKSLFHYLAAQALYSTAPDKPNLKCPGYDCAGYKVGDKMVFYIAWKFYHFGCRFVVFWNEMKCVHWFSFHLFMSHPHLILTPRKIKSLRYND